MPISQIVPIKNSILRTKQLFQDGHPIKLSSDIVTATNCYAYSLGVTYPEKKNEYLYRPGFTEELEYEVGNTEDLMDKIELDLQNLKISFRRFDLKDEKSLRKNEYLIKVLYSFVSRFNDDFHFIRQDKDTGIWFHKQGWYNQPVLISPTPNKEPSVLNTLFYVYHSVGYFAITEQMGEP